MKTYIKNARLITPFEMKDGLVIVEDGKIIGITSHADAEPDTQIVDAAGLYMTPGFIDIHVHGGGGFSAMSDNSEDIAAMCRAHAQYGTTGILPTTMSARVEYIEEAILAIKNAVGLDTGAEILGAHLEGPCLSLKQSGAQAPDELKIPAQFDMMALVNMWDGIKMVGVAPELDGALELAEKLTARGIVASIAHSDATYEQVEEAIRHGFSDVTHLYSGCSGMIRINSYRIPGVIEAGLNLDSLTTQVIGDGKHLPLSLLSLIYRCKGAELIELITDGLEFAAGELQEGVCYRQKSGMETVYEDGVMKLTNRQAFAGSVATMNRLIRNMRAAGAPLKEAVRMATENPARRIGANNKGRIAVGMDADLVLFDENIDVKWVMAKGKILRSDL